MLVSAHAVLYFWGIVGCLVVAAGCNHGWHHARDRHLRARLARASVREREPVALVPESPTVAPDDDVDSASRA